MNTNENVSMGEVILYQPDNTIRLEVRVEDETVWLSRQQMAQLFGRDIKTIGKHINNALREELYGFSTVAFFATVQIEGHRMVERNIEHYNLDMILSVGYRVKSQKGIQFRIWSNRVLKEYLLKGYAMNRHMEQVAKFMVETGQHITESKVKFDLLTQYIEDVLSDYNDINEDTRMQFELIHEALAELQVKNREQDNPRRLIGFKRSTEKCVPSY